MQHIRHRIMCLPVIRHIRHKPRLFIALAAGVLAFVIGTHLTPRLTTAALIGWNTCALLYLAMAMETMFNASRERMQKRAQLHDDGEWVILLISVIAAALSFIAIVGELATTKDAAGWLKGMHIGLSGLTLITSWAFIHTAFAFHYGPRLLFARRPRHGQSVPDLSGERPAALYRLSLLLLHHRHVRPDRRRRLRYHGDPAHGDHPLRAGLSVQCHRAGLDDQYRGIVDLKISPKHLLRQARQFSWRKNGAPELVRGASRRLSEKNVTTL